jgi:hypothetical protein
VRRRAVGLATGLLVLAACGAGGPGAISPGAPACPTPAIDDRLEPEPSPTLCPSGSGDGQGGQGGQGGQAGAGGGNTIMRVWTEIAEVSDGSTYSLIEQSYRAVVQVNLSGGDGSWAFTGSAQITATYSSEYRTKLEDLAGAPCTVHFTDDATASGAVQVDGGLEARDGFYEFHVNVPGIDTGTNATVRDDSACGGTNISERTPWSAAPITAGGSGEYSGTSISGSESAPRLGGTDSTTWSFTLPS